MLDDVDDVASGYERVASTYMRVRDPGVGPDVVAHWAKGLPPGARVLDVGCGDGVPITAALLAVGLTVQGVDASPSMVAAFRVRFPQVPVECADVECCSSLHQRFDGIVSWGLVFLLPPDMQRRVVARMAEALVDGGQLLFTAPRQVCSWADALTGRTSWSLGHEAYRDELARHGVIVERTAEDIGGNAYCLGIRRSE